MLRWPATSPDLLPTENAWDNMGRQLRPADTTADSEDRAPSSPPHTTSDDANMQSAPQNNTSATLLPPQLSATAKLGRLPEDSRREDYPVTRTGETTANTTNASRTSQRHVGTPFTNQRLVNYSSAGSSTNRKAFTVCSSQSDDKCAYIKVSLSILIGRAAVWKISHQELIGERRSAILLTRSAAVRNARRHFTSAFFVGPPTWTSDTGDQRRTLSSNFFPTAPPGRHIRDGVKSSVKLCRRKYIHSCEAQYVSIPGMERAENSEAGSVKYGDAFSSSQQPMATYKLLLGAYSIEVYPVRMLAYHHDELGSIPGQVTPGFSQEGIVPDDAAADGPVYFWEVRGGEFLSTRSRSRGKGRESSSRIANTNETAMNCGKTSASLSVTGKKCRCEWRKASPLVVSQPLAGEDVVSSLEKMLERGWGAGGNCGRQLHSRRGRYLISHAGIMPNDVAGRRDLPFSPPLHSAAASFLPHFALISSKLDSQPSVSSVSRPFVLRSRDLQKFVLFGGNTENYVTQRIDVRRIVESRFQLTDEKIDVWLTDGRSTDGSDGWLGALAISPLRADLIRVPMSTIDDVSHMKNTYGWQCTRQGISDRCFNSCRSEELGLLEIQHLSSVNVLPVCRSAYTSKALSAEVNTKSVACLPFCLYEQASECRSKYEKCCLSAVLPIRARLSVQKSKALSAEVNTKSVACLPFCLYEQGSECRIVELLKT
ncbi:hypothetical protein PR048_014121 [Dryococelus australis]|uniref:FZ domain-containing protein n=1 Tax=Dryococelus australis TaxID=614101 RepID=A0ABQ9HDI6_9NEOP|nr:hypothetical protein PR048_014121 [Dryococelus australis]